MLVGGGTLSRETVVQREIRRQHQNAGQCARVAQAGVPSMKLIANMPGQTERRIRNVLIMPHTPMPDVRLSNPEIDRLIAYLDSLRDSTSDSPLAPRKGDGEKPQYPDPT